MAIEVSYQIGEISGFKCCYCEKHLGSTYRDESGNEYSDTGFEDFVYCPYCGRELYTD